MKRWPSFLMLALLLGSVAISQAFVAQDRPAGGPAMTASAEKFIASLNAEQKPVVLLDYDHASRLDFHFIPKNERKGLQLRDMTDGQQQLARNLLASCLSQVGYEKATTIMSLEKILQKLEGESARFKRDYLRYYVTIFGTPGEGKWGLSFEGHHLSLNFVVDGDKIVAHTPAFFGANPAVVKANYGVGPAKDTRVLGQEELLGFELLASLDAKQRKVAVLAAEAPADIRGPADQQPPQGKPEGIAAQDLNSEQRETLQKLIEVYAHNMPAKTADQELQKIEEAGFEKIHFAWAGADKPGIGHYYRVQGPTFLIEFVNVQPDAAGNVANHIHSVWRNPAGDFAVPINK